MFKCTNKAVRVSKKVLIITGAMAKGIAYMLISGFFKANEHIKTKKQIKINIKLIWVFRENIPVRNKAKNKNTMSRQRPT